MENTNPIKSQVGGTQKIFGLDTLELAARNSLFTAEEITQQPRVWREAYAHVDANSDEINAWLLPKLRQPRVQVLFCGAGTSAYIGDTIAASLRSKYRSAIPVDFKSVGTTDLILNPEQYFSDDRPTVMVSFARSGDSPESIASVELADDMLSDCYHLIFTCNPKGKLAEYAKDDSSTLCLMMPEGTNDRGFAMTSSYSSMLVSCAAVFTPDTAQFESAAQLSEKVIGDYFSKLAPVAISPFDRLVVLGSGALIGTAREAALKCLELAAGELVAISDTPLGIRHGPKMVISSGTVVINLISSEPHAMKYHRDLLAELKSDGRAAYIVELSPETMFPEYNDVLEDVWLSLVYIVCCQIFAFLKSYTLGVTVDSPCASGEVNRVVQGVKIYPYKPEIA